MKYPKEPLKPEVNITKEKFKRYLRVQHAGKYNMITEWTSAASAAGLTKDEYMEICENYLKYLNKYGSEE